MSFSLQVTEETDLAEIVAIMNAAFRGTSTEQSWSVETDYLTGNRTDESLLREEIAGGAQFLLAREDGTSVIEGCVSLKVLSLERWYLGSLTVDPALQNTGLGRKLLRCAEEYAIAHGARMMEITVVNVRSALIAWYERRGYRLTGETRPFPYGSIALEYRHELTWSLWSLRKDFSRSVSLDNRSVLSYVPKHPTTLQLRSSRDSGRDSRGISSVRAQDQRIEQAI